LKALVWKGSMPLPERFGAREQPSSRANRFPWMNGAAAKLKRSAFVGCRGDGGLVLSSLILAAGFFGGCYPKAGPAPGPLSAGSVASASARWPGVTETSLSAGRNLFLGNCNACHDYPALGQISEESWPRIVEKMGNKAHLNPDERASVLHFVLAARSEAAPHDSPP
jgi:hypothetical protein